MATISFGSEYKYRTGTIEGASVSSFDSAKVVVVYAQTSGTDEGYGIVGSIANEDELSYGSENAFVTANISYFPSVASLSSSQFVAVFKDGSDSDKGKAVIGNISGTTISSYGTVAEFSTGTVTTIRVTALDSTHFMVVWERGTKCYGIIGTVSGSTISFGSEYVFNSNTNSTGPDVSTIDSTHTVITYRDSAGDNEGEARIATISGSTISYGNAYRFGDASSNAQMVRCSVLDSTHFVVSWRKTDGVASSYRYKARIGVISGSTISYGTAQNIFDTQPANSIVCSAMNSSRFVLAYSISGGAGKAKVCEVVDGDDFTMGTEAEFSSNNVDSEYKVTVQGLSSTSFIVIYSDYTDYDGKSKIGISAVTNASTIQTKGNIKNAVSINIQTKASIKVGGVSTNLQAKANITLHYSTLIQTKARIALTAPSNFILDVKSAQSILITWSKAPNSDKTMVRYQEGGYPTNPYDGLQAYFDTGNSHLLTGLTENTTYYFRAWAWKDNS